MAASARLRVADAARPRRRRRGCGCGAAIPTVSAGDREPHRPRAARPLPRARSRRGSRGCRQRCRDREPTAAVERRARDVVQRARADPGRRLLRSAGPHSHRRRPDRRREHAGADRRGRRCVRGAAGLPRARSSGSGGPARRSTTPTGTPRPRTGPIRRVGAVLDSLASALRGSAYEENDLGAAAAAPAAARRDRADDRAAGTVATETPLAPFTAGPGAARRAARARRFRPGPRGAYDGRQLSARRSPQHLVAVLLTAAAACTLLTSASARTAAGADVGWLGFGNTPDELRHSPLTEITKDNVSKLGRLFTVDFRRSTRASGAASSRIRSSRTARST